MVFDDRRAGFHQTGFFATVATLEDDGRGSESEVMLEISEASEEQLGCTFGWANGLGGIEVTCSEGSTG